MDTMRFSLLTRTLTGMPSRRDVVRGLAGAGLGLGPVHLPAITDAKKKRKKKRKKRRHKPSRSEGILCTKEGQPCTKAGNTCQKQFCLQAPFTITAAWTEIADHDTYLFVPPQDETTGPAPHIDYGCNPNSYPCEEEYPFVCVDNDEISAGDEITTIHHLLPGTYEYWIELFATTPAGELTVTLKDGSGRVVREWKNPANATLNQLGWHVFDFDGASGRVTSSDELINDDNGMPRSAHDPSTLICP